ncbi:YcfL family protein [Pseudomonas gingeri]|uniref:YcfL family protein n=1 Tax=Pseudomonas gingeri TaxID=117681 RepID=UPI00159FF8E1|nr:YcfL family protein [Pseudomonas gingeri]NWD69423.1 YcfL family protein [Pseudomonas gingeri]NWD73870.1 YcfL family protein [Pseudomonas gingeri]
MRFKLIAAVALALLAGCVTPPPPPPAPGSAASKIVAMGPMENIEVGAIRVARENGFLTVKVQLSNTRTKNNMMYYRFSWLGNDGFPVSDDEVWKTLNLYGAQSTFLQAIAPTPKATDFRLEVKTP